MVALILVACVSSYGDATYGVFGGVDSVAASGNGRLTIAFDAYGRLNLCRWPNPTSPNQVTYTRSAQAAGGAKWALDDGDGVRWLIADAPGEATMVDGPAPIVQINNTTLGVSQTAFVVPDRDIAVFRIQFAEDPPQDSVIWHADFSPCTSAMRGVPGSEALFANRRDMVAFAEDRVYHARTSEANSIAWEESERWRTGGLQPAWFGKGSGVWIGYEASAPFVHAVCSTREQDDSGGTRVTRAVGQCYSVVRVPLDETTHSATIYLAIGGKRSEVDGAIEFAKQTGFDALLLATQEWWTTKAREITAAPVPAGQLSTLYTRAARQLQVSVSADGGAIARAITAQAPLGVDIPRQGAWTTLALDFINLRSAAEAHIAFYGRGLRQGDGVDGTLPAALYADGVEAAPSSVLDVQATAWFLWSAWQHDAFLQDEQRAAYRVATWEAVHKAGDFIASWSRAVHNTPALSFEPAMMRDASTSETMAVACAGLRSATAFAQATGTEKPEWNARVSEMTEALRIRAMGADGKFKVEDPIALWPAELVAAGDPRWDPAVQRALAELSAQSPEDALKALANLAMLLRDQREKLAQLEPLLAPVIQRALDAYPCDSYYASLALASIILVYSHGAF